jgi:hypothetical protein
MVRLALFVSGRILQKKRHNNEERVLGLSAGEDGFSKNCR